MGPGQLPARCNAVAFGDLVLDLEAQIVPIRQRARGGASGVEIEIRIGHLWTVKDETITRLEVFPAREDARKAAEGG